jgi:hypothetical protein
MKKMWEVVKASQRKFDTVLARGKQMKFGKNGGMFVYDKGLAKEIDEKFGTKRGATHDVVVSEVNNERDAIHDPGHKYFFGSMPALPWHKYDKDGKRIE